MSKDVIRATMAQVEAAVKGIPGVHIQDLRNFLEGPMSLTKKGALKLPLVLPAEEVLHSGADVSAVVKGEWKIVPLLLFIADPADQAVDVETPPQG